MGHCDVVLGPMQTASDAPPIGLNGPAGSQAAGTAFSLSRQRAFEPITVGHQVIRLAANEHEVVEAQRLRYRVFYEELGARAAPQVAALQTDFDRFDSTCDHLVVVDQSTPNQPQIVGTYRFMRLTHAQQAGDFYSADEYDVTPLKANGGEVMELGRSCVDPSFRNRHTMQLLWRGIAAYAITHGIDLMFGCASFPGTDLPALAQPLSYLHYNHLAPDHLRAKALPERFSSMSLLAPEAVDRKQALASMPPLIKGYLRLGAYIGEGAVIDHQFNTTDVCIIVKTDQMTGRYARHYALDGTQASGGSARQVS